MALHLPENLKKIADAIAANNAKNELKIHRFMGKIIHVAEDHKCTQNTEQENEQPEQHLKSSSSEL